MQLPRETEARRGVKRLVTLWQEVTGGKSPHSCMTTAVCPDLPIPIPFPQEPMHTLSCCASPSVLKIQVKMGQRALWGCLMEWHG